MLGAARLLRISWDEAWGIMERAVGRGLKAKKRRIIARLGVDEKAVAKGHQYFTLVSDLDRGTVEFIAEGRKIASLDAYYDSLTVRQKAGIRAVAMDMCVKLPRKCGHRVKGFSGKRGPDPSNNKGAIHRDTPSQTEPSTVLSRPPARGCGGLLKDPTRSLFLAGRP